MKKFDKNYYWLGLALVGYLVSITKLSAVLPSIMQDEYVYSAASRLQSFQDQIYGNYVFNVIFSTTNMCGADFYGCAKGINSLFLAVVLVFTFAISKTFLSVRTSALITAVTSFSPIVIYSSFFMPDTMFYAFALAAVFFAVKLQNNKPMVFVAILGLTVGVAALVKSHALFMVPALMLFIGLLMLRRDNYSKLRSVGFAFLFALVAITSKIAIGLIFAGLNGVTIFGESYDGSLFNFFGSALIATNAGLSLPLAMNHGLMATTTVEIAGQTNSTEFLLSFLWQLLMHGSFLLTVAFLPIVHGISSFWRTIKNSQPFSPREQIAFLATSLISSSVILVAAFEALVTVSGDNHDFRVITRYYDYLIPLLLLLTFSVYKSESALLKYRLVGLSFGVGALIFGITNYPNHLSPKYSDSPMVVGMLSNQGTEIFLYVLASAVLFFYFFSNIKNATSFAIVATVLMTLVSGQVSLSELAQRNSSLAFFDTAGKEASKYLEQVPGEEIIIFGNQTVTAVTPKFWIDKPNIASRIVEKGGSISDSDAAGYEYALLIGELGSNLTGIKVLEGNGFALFQLQR